MFTLKIIWRNGDSITLSNVDDYGLVNEECTTVFFYKKNGVNSFVPVDSVLYFGSPY